MKTVTLGSTIYEDLMSEIRPPTPRRDEQTPPIPPHDERK
jgi:hypothetical protein